MSFLFNNTGYSQEADSVSLDQLLEMPLSALADVEVVTASKTPRLSSDITQKVDVITEQQINQIVSGNRNIAELIQYLPGASVKVLSRNDANWGAYGGIGPKYCTYMVQGLPVDAFADPMSIEAMAIERIEIQRGPASVLYPSYLSQDFAGNQSPLAGTVNLILKEHITRPQTMISLDYGSYNTVAGRAYHQNNFGRLHVMGGISVEKSDYTDYGSTGSWLNMLDEPEYKKGKAFLGANMYLDKAEKHKITLFGNQTLHWGDAGRTFREYDHKYSLVNAGYTGLLTDHIKVTLKSGLRWYDREWQGDTYDSASSSYTLLETSGVEQLIVPVDLSLTLSHLNNSNFTFGADYQQAMYETWVKPVNLSKTTGNDASASQVGAYIQEELQLSKFTIRAGGRFNRVMYDINKFGGQAPDSSSKAWNKMLWSAGINYRVTEKLILFTNAGNSFMPPGQKSIGGTLSASDMNVPGKNGQLPNPDLDHENGLGIDLGLDYSLPLDIYLSVRAFHTVITDAIIDNVISQDPSQTMSVNADGKTIGQGFECGLKQQIKKDIDWFANITYTHSESVDPDNPDKDGEEVPFVPEVMGNVGVTLYLPHDIEISHRAHFGGRFYDSSLRSDRKSFDSGELLNMIVSKTFNFNEDGNLNVFIKFYNITNNKYEMPWGFKDPGFNSHFGARVIF